MSNALRHDNNRFILIGKIKGLGIEAKRARTHALKAKGKSIQYDFDARKRFVGFDIRHHLLAYAFLRGIPYSKLERSCRKDNKPNPNFIYKIVELHAPKWIDVAPEERPKPYFKCIKYEPSLNDISAWLSAEVV